MGEIIWIWIMIAKFSSAKYLQTASNALHKYSAKPFSSYLSGD